MVPRMLVPPLNSLPAIRVDARKVMRSLVPDTAWGSLTNLMGVVVPPKAVDQLRCYASAVPAPGTLVRPGWRRG